MAKSSAEEYRALSAPMGIYEQRKEGTFMLRVRLPAAGVLPHQMRTLSAVARKHGNGVLHVTTRQGIQVHCVRLGRIQAALMELNGAELSTKGGGGNTVRNITACRALAEASRRPLAADRQKVPSRLPRHSP